MISMYLGVICHESSHAISFESLLREIQHGVERLNRARSMIPNRCSRSQRRTSVSWHCLDVQVRKGGKRRDKIERQRQRRRIIPASIVEFMPRHNREKHSLIINKESDVRSDLPVQMEKGKSPMVCVPASSKGSMNDDEEEEEEMIWVLVPVV